ncbi:hypothetical protein L6164_002662 [Bauhinia variegata]|uniref:Uncharacterized protein n=1 Tax=Bauhinia variegata TaxID=167791 RepID=A0ACB9Q1J6_BAUVA|nr:hypothetical protein L6164_002662 [Bauhinia variegata]
MIIHSIAVFQGESVAKKCSRFVLLVWLGLAFVLMQSYTANLSSILTLNQLKPSHPTIDSLIRDKEDVGYRHGSFIRDLLRDHLHFDESRLKNYSKMEDYRNALNKGTSKGGIAAMFDELPYIKVLLKKHSSKKAFGVNYDDLQDQYDQLSSETASLTAQSFAGLFIITGSLILLALLVSESHIWKRPFMLVKILSQKYLFSASSRKVNPSDDGSTNGGDAGETTEGNNHLQRFPRSLSLPV